MQDWPYEISEPEKIEDYLKYYDQVTDEDEKFYLMELLLQATEDQTEISKFNYYWLKIKTRLINDFSIHEYTIHYWSCFENDNLEDNSNITEYMRALWFVQNYREKYYKTTGFGKVKL